MIDFCTNRIWEEVTKNKQKGIKFKQKVKNKILNMQIKISTLVVVFGAAYKSVLSCD